MFLSLARDIFRYVFFLFFLSDVVVAAAVFTHVSFFICCLLVLQKCDNTILNSLKILSDLVQRRRAVIYEDEHNMKEIPNILVVSASHLPDFKAFLVRDGSLSPLKTTLGEIVPFGRARQATVELIEAFLRTNNSYVFNAVISGEILPIILDLFFKYKWNNILHQSVFNILSIMLQSPNEKAVHYVIEDCHLLDRILAAEYENEEVFVKTNVSFGYIAFLTRLSLLIDGLVQHHPFVHEILVSRGDWKKYVTDILAPRNSRESRLLGGGLRYPAESTDDDDVGDLSREGDLEDWFFERSPEDDDESLILIQAESGCFEEPDDVVQEPMRFSDSEESSDSDDETIVKRDLAFDDSDNEDPFPSSQDCSPKE